VKSVRKECEPYAGEQYSEEMELLQTIPGIDELSSMVIVAETGEDMKKFENSSKFTVWVGLYPRNDESAGKYKSTAITKGNKHLKSAPVQAAWGQQRTGFTTNRNSMP